jgi:hypothetical protein
MAAESPPHHLHFVLIPFVRTVSGTMNTKYREWERLGIFQEICLDKKEKSEILAGGVRRGIAPMPKSVRLPRFLILRVEYS